MNERWYHYGLLKYWKNKRGYYEQLCANKQLRWNKKIPWKIQTIKDSSRKSR